MTDTVATRRARRSHGTAAHARRTRPERTGRTVVGEERHGGGTRAERWLRAVRARPLERAVPFPDWARPLVRAVVGRRRPPPVTFGPATRGALAAAGATAAAWGGAVRLPRAPRETPDDVETIAHEVSHTVVGGPRPSFFEGPTTDPGETEARAVGRTVRGIAASLGASPGLARRTVAALTGAKRAVVAAAPRRPRASAGVAVQRALAPGAPDVRSLPVARAAAPAGGVPGTSALGLDPSSALSSARSAVAEGSSSVRSAVTEGASSVTRGAAEGAAAFVDRGEATAGDALERAESIARAAGGDALRSLGAAAGAARDPASQLGYLLEALEERVVAELERRGGRYAGAF